MFKLSIFNKHDKHSLKKTNVHRVQSHIKVLKLLGGFEPYEQNDNQNLSAGNWFEPPGKRMNLCMDFRHNKLNYSASSDFKIMPFYKKIF